MLAVEERQSLEALSRDEKTAARALAQLKDKHEQEVEKAQKLRQDKDAQTVKRQEASFQIIRLSSAPLLWSL